MLPELEKHVSEIKMPSSLCLVSHILMLTCTMLFWHAKQLIQTYVLHHFLRSIKLHQGRKQGISGGSPKAAEHLVGSEQETPCSTK